MEEHPVVSVLNYDIWEHILAFLKPTEEFMPAMVCRDFYQILRAKRVKRVKRGHRVWITDITVFCKTQEWVKFIILTSRQDLQGQWASRLEDKYKGLSKIYNVYVLIKQNALHNGYYETYKFIQNIINYETIPIFPDDILKLTDNNYGFLRNMLDDLVPVKSIAFICKVLETLNLPLIRALLTNNPEINSDKYLHYYNFGQTLNTNSVIDYTYEIIYARQKQIDICNAREILNFVADMYGKYSNVTGAFEYTLDEYILSKTKLNDVIFLHEVIGVPGCAGISILALKYDRLDILEYALEKQFPLCKSVSATIIKTMPDLAKKYQIVAGTD